MTIKLPPEEEKRYRLLSLHSMLSSLFWGVIQDNHRTISDVTEKTGYNKERVRNLFSQNPQWSTRAILDVAEALDLELIVDARERSTGKIYTPSGIKDES